MGPSPLLSCLLWAAMVCVCVAQTPRFLVTAPRLLHVGVKEDVWVQMEWPRGAKVPNDVAVEMYLRNQKSFDECSERYRLNLNTRNNHISKQTIELTPTRASTCKLEERRSSRYVQLVITSAALGALGKVVSIPISYKKGYIFIQTDKSVYTPKDSVNIRMFTLDHMMRPTEDFITSSVINAEGLQVRKMQKLSGTSVVTDKLIIPDISTTGVWRISAYYTSAPESNFTTEFEVKKYVLPNFEVKIIPELPYFQINKAQFRIKVEARYVYGEPVDGVVHVRIGIIDQTGKKTMLQGLEQQVKMEDAEGTIQISKDAILKKIAQSAENLVGSTFYIVATVLEKASGTLEEKELTSVKFVTSPYNLDFSKTRKYYTPGTPAQIVAEVTYTDGTPASGVTVQLLKANTQLSSFRSDEDGKVVFHINTNTKEKTLDLMVRAEGSDGRQEESLILTPYTSKTNSFLHMDVPIQVLSPGESIKVTVKVVTPHSGSVQRIYYMVLNKGQILDLRFIEKSEFMVFAVPVSTKMVPSFRIIAYYYLDSEIVANSVWIDVSDVCEGKLQIKTDVKDSLLPGSQFKLTLETDEVTKVSLSAVDTAVYLVNSKGKLTPGKVFKAMNDYDLGCSPGGGRDSNSVFMDAGVAFVSSYDYSDLTVLGCRVPQRKKRSIDFTALAKQKADRYSSPDLKKCCNNGMVLLPPRMERNCDIRAKRVESADCRNAFLDCCQYAEDLRKKITLEKRKKNTIGRTQTADEEEDFTDESEVQVRSDFLETWLWKTVTVNRKYTETSIVPDSITTWEIQAVGMSTGKGFCVADPVKVKVFKPFHIHLRVPYTVKRFEQIELRPVLYNFENHDLKVRVFMDKTEGVCTPSTSDGRTKGQIVTVAKKSALSIPFSVVPIGKENPTITIKALGPVGVSDAVQKVLHIEREGVPVVEEKTYVLNPEDKTRSFLRIDQDLPSNVIPDGESSSQVKAIMDSPINTINNTLSSDGVIKLIRVPHGCAEQTMISTAPGVYAMRYLDQTDKWPTLPADRREHGLENMRNGYTRILQYRKRDGSYGAWLNRPSSTWLTSFVVKVMSLCHKYIDIDDEGIQKSVSYLTTKQTDSGAFLETTPVIHQDMIGGVLGKNAEVSLTAYVLIALHHSEDFLPEDDIKKSSISKGLDYLRTALTSLSEPYPLAITAYALNLISTNSNLKDQAYKNLMSKAQKTSNPAQMYFGPEGTALAVETTSYALLTALLRDDIPNANLMYTWLTEQQNYGGGFKSTQDTVMALEALSEYWFQTSDNDRNELHLEFNSPGRSEKNNFILRNQDFIQEDLRSLGKTFTVKVSGKGTGILTVLKRYNIMKVEDSDCSQLGLEVTVHGDETVDEVDYGDYEDGEMADEPLGNIHWHDLRSRARREVSQPKEKSVKVVYSVSLWRKAKDRATGMAIVDITMLSGFEPSIQDLNKLKDGSERYISHYEIQGGRLFMYFDEVTSHKDIVTFEAFQTVKVSPLQPASAVLYDFYEPGNKCRVFYSAPSRTTFISTLCSNYVCQCAEGPCPTLRKTADIKEKDKRQQFACDTPRVMYGYRVKVLEMEPEDAFIVYKVQIIEVLKRNADEDIKAGDTRYFYQRAACKMRLQSGTKEYLIMGQDGQTEDEEKKMRYFLENNSWVEELDSPQACETAQDPNKCSNMNIFMNDYQNNGCRAP